MASSTSSRARAMAVPLALILGGCVVNNIALEVMISDKIRWSDVKAGPLLTLLQYALVSLLMLPKALELAPVADDVAGAKGPSAVSGAWGGAVTAGGWRLSLRPTTVPLPHYARMAGLFAVMSLLNNLAFAFHISQPMHMVFRSANLMVTYAFGKLFFGKSYTREALLSIVLLTAGAACNTIAEATMGDTARKAARGGAGGSCSATASSCGSPASLDLDLDLVAMPTPAAAAGATASGAGPAYMLTWAIGVGILTAVLCLQSVLGEYQNWTGRTFGKKAAAPAPASTASSTASPSPSQKGPGLAEEGMFYMHFFSLPVLALLLLVRPTPPDSSSPFPLTLTTSGVEERLRLWGASPPCSEYLPEVVAREGTGLVTRVAASGVSSLLSLVGQSSLPAMWLFVLLNVVTQYACIRGVYALISATDNLTVNVVLTVRKAVSVIVSIVSFGNTFTPVHWVGAFLVFLGAYLFGKLPNGGMVGGAAAAPSVAPLAGGAAAMAAPRGRGAAGQLATSAAGAKESARGREGSRARERSRDPEAASGSGKVRSPSNSRARSSAVGAASSAAKRRPAAK